MSLRARAEGRAGALPRGRGPSLGAGPCSGAEGGVRDIAGARGSLPYLLELKQGEPEGPSLVCGGEVGRWEVCRPAALGWI